MISVHTTCGTTDSETGDAGTGDALELERTFDGTGVVGTGAVMFSVLSPAAFPGLVEVGTPERPDVVGYDDDEDDDDYSYGDDYEDDEEEIFDEFEEGDDEEEEPSDEEEEEEL